MEFTFLNILWIVFLVLMSILAIRIFFGVVIPLIIVGITALCIKISEWKNKKKS